MKVFFVKKNRMLLSAYRDKVIVGCISTLCSNCITIQDRKRGNPRPESIAIYNRLMKGLIILIKILVIMDTHIDSWNGGKIVCEIATYNSFLIYQNSRLERLAILNTDYN